MAWPAQSDLLRAPQEAYTDTQAAQARAGTAETAAAALRHQLKAQAAVNGNLQQQVAAAGVREAVARAAASSAEERLTAFVADTGGTEDARVELLQRQLHAVRAAHAASLELAASAEVRVGGPAARCQHCCCFLLPLSAAAFWVSISCSLSFLPFC